MLNLEAWFIRMGDVFTMWLIAGLAVALVVGRIIQAAKIREGR